MSDGCLRILESTQEVFVIRGKLQRFAIASARNALRIVEPSTSKSGLMDGFAAGDLLGCILTALKLTTPLVCAASDLIVLNGFYGKDWKRSASQIVWIRLYS